MGKVPGKLKNCIGQCGRYLHPAVAILPYDFVRDAAANFAFFTELYVVLTVGAACHETPSLLFRVCVVDFVEYLSLAND